jgi:hypothetical protein
MPDPPDQLTAAEGPVEAPEPVVGPIPAATVEIKTQAEFPVVREPDATVLDPAPPVRVAPPPLWVDPPPGAVVPAAPLPPLAPAAPERTEPQGPPTLETPAAPVVLPPPEPPRVRRPEAELDTPAPPELPRALRRANGRSKAFSILMPVTGTPSSFGIRAVGVAAIIAAAVAAYRAFEHRVAHRAIAARQELEGVLALQPGMPAAPPPVGRPHLSVAAPVVAPLPETVPRTSVALSCLNLRADVHAQVMIDEGLILPLPLDAYPVSPGPHKLTITALRRHHASHRLDITDEDTRCPGRQLSVTLRHHPARD